VRKGEREGKLVKKFAEKNKIKKIIFDLFFVVDKSNLSMIMVFVRIDSPGKVITGGVVPLVHAVYTKKVRYWEFVEFQ
jgi:hypothetical protein